MVLDKNPEEERLEIRESYLDERMLPPGEESDSVAAGAYAQSEKNPFEAVDRFVENVRQYLDRCRELELLLASGERRKDTSLWGIPPERRRPTEFKFGAAEEAVQSAKACLDMGAKLLEWL